MLRVSFQFCNCFQLILVLLLSLSIDLSEMSLGKPPQTIDGVQVAVRILVILGWSVRHEQQRAAMLSRTGTVGCEKHTMSHTVFHICIQDQDLLPGSVWHSSQPPPVVTHG